MPTKYMNKNPSKCREWNRSRIQVWEHELGKNTLNEANIETQEHNTNTKGARQSAAEGTG